MYDELTEVDIKKMQEEIDYRVHVVRPKCVKEVARTAAFGDRSENYEYKAAKQELRRCDSRLRYLRRMIETAKVVKPDTREGVVGLFDKVELYYEDVQETETITIMTNLRADTLNNIITQEAPLARAIMGKRVGDRVLVKVSDKVQYYVQIRAIEKGEDDESLPISSY